jgi:Arc/MetJ family transcription regulator
MAAVEEAPRRLVRQRERVEGLADMWGAGWDGDLAAMREGRHADQQR